MISDVLKSPEYYSKNKRKFNRDYNWKWKRIAGPDYIGSCSYLFQDFYSGWTVMHKGTYPTHTDFARYYFSHINAMRSGDELKRPEDHHYGRTVTDIVRLAEKYRSMCKDDTITLEQYFDDIVNHVIIETFNGQMREIKLMDEYDRCGFTAEQTSDHWDKDLGVDMIIRKNGVIKDYIQLKPITTFIGNKNESLVRDRIVFYKKEEDKKTECMECGYDYYPTKFILYNEDHPDTWCSIGSRRSFLLEELCTEEGIALHKADDFGYAK